MDSYRKFYNTAAWQNCREAYKKYCGGLCERCLAKGLIVPGHVVHHKIYMDAEKIKNPELALNFDNLELLCWSCHEQEHDRNNSGKHSRKPRYKFDELGRLIISPHSDEK
jgi:5-methylcytosine-specific restriction endonuclease McrA